MKNMFLAAFAAILATAALVGCGGSSSAPDPERVVIDGDSLASIAYPATTWPTSLQQQMPGTSFVHAAHPTTTASMTLVRYDFLVHPVRPGVLVLVTGSNDVWTGEPVDRTWSALTYLWKRARGDGFKVIAATIGPVYGGTGLHEAARVELNRRIRAASGAYDALLDLDRLFPDPADTQLLVDGLHYTPTGNLLVLAEVARLIRLTSAQP